MELLIQAIPEIAKEPCFALHGGTAINLFIRNMPRLSVDIDLTYVPLEDRETSLKNIATTLEKIKTNLEKINPDIKVVHQEDISKLQITSQEAHIKLEVNQTIRGTISAPVEMTLCDKAQDEFDAFCAIPVVPKGQLYGGKICAALDRQHPRDLFDIKYLLENEGFSEEIKTGFLFCLISSDRPINEIIRPNLKDQNLTMRNHFEGMSKEPFAYAEFEDTRRKLIQTINAELTSEDKEFLISIKEGNPNWGIYDFSQFPAVQWKLRNIQTLKAGNPKKHAEQLAILKEKLGM